MNSFGKRLAAFKDYWHNERKVAAISVFTLLVLSSQILILVFPNIIKVRVHMVHDNMAEIARNWDKTFSNFINHSYRSCIMDVRYLANQDSCYNLCKDFCDYDGGNVIASSIFFKEGVFNDSVPFMPYYCSLDSTSHNLYSEFQEAADYINSNDFRFSDANSGNYFVNPNAYIPEQLKEYRIYTYSFTIPVNAHGDNALVNIYYKIDPLLANLNRSNISENGLTFFIDKNNDIMLHPDVSMLGRSASEWIATAYEDATEAYDSVFRYLDIAHQDRSGMDYTVRSSTSRKYRIMACPIYSMDAAIVYIIDHKSTRKQLGANVLFENVLFLIIMFVFIQWSNRLVVRTIKIESENKKTLEAELNSAALIQKSMLSLPVKFEGIDISSMLIPAKAIGGDLYYSYVHNGKLYFCLGDVSGKGVPASIFMSRVITLFQILMPIYPTAGQLISKINGYLCKGNDSLMFVTLFLGIFDPETGKLEYCNAGHEAPLLYSGDKEKNGRHIERSACIPLGIDNSFNFSSSFLDFPVGSTLFVYSDGITEAMNDDNELFESRRVAEVIDHCVRKFDAKQINGQIIRSVQAFAGNRQQSDDITVMTIRRLS